MLEGLIVKFESVLFDVLKDDVVEEKPHYE